MAFDRAIALLGENARGAALGEVGAGTGESAAFARAAGAAGTAGTAVAGAVVAETEFAAAGAGAAGSGAAAGTAGIGVAAAAAPGADSAGTGAGIAMPAVGSRAGAGASGIFFASFAIPTVPVMLTPWPPAAFSETFGTALVAVLASSAALAAGAASEIDAAFDEPPSSVSRGADGAAGLLVATCNSGAFFLRKTSGRFKSSPETQ